MDKDRSRGTTKKITDKRLRLYDIVSRTRTHRVVRERLGIAAADYKNG